MPHKLSFIDGEFVEGEKKSGKILGTLELDPSGKAKLSFSPEANLIVRRTATRQAESVCRSGFLLKSGERVGTGHELEVVEGDTLNEAHLREGHKYNR